MAMSYHLTLVLGHSSSSVWLVLILGVSTPRMILQSHVLSEPSDAFYNLEAQDVQDLSCASGPRACLESLPSSGPYSTCQIHLCGPCCGLVTSRGCGMLVLPVFKDRRQERIILCSRVFASLLEFQKILPAQCNNDEKSCYSSADINSGETN